MRGLLHHLGLTLKLNFRSGQTIAYGYLVPLFFLLAFGSLFRSGNPPLVHEMGQLLTITILGGACFGMPTAMVAERERGVWRRYRLLPTATSGIILSTMIARFILVLSAAVMQIALARIIYGTTLPEHPLQMLIAFAFVSFAFLGMGLVIAMAAETVPAVQALGQAIFLPMIIIGGVGVPLRALPSWAQHVAAFLPGRYAVQVLQACENGAGLSGASFALVALTGIGLAACIAGAKLFRWDVGQKIPTRAMPWMAGAVLMWVAVGFAAEATGQLRPAQRPAPESTLLTAIAAPNPPQAPWTQITRAQTESITYDDLPDDAGTIVPVAANLNDLDEEQFKRLESILNAIYDWDSARTKDAGQRVRNLLSIISVTDLAPDPLEGPVALAIFNRLLEEFRDPQLIQILTWIILNPNEGTVFINLQDLGLQIPATEPEVRERSVMYAMKLLQRLLGKKPPP